MTNDKDIAVVDEIIGAATVADANAAALRHVPQLMTPGFSAYLTQATERELRAHGKTVRFFALTRLAEYVGATMRNVLRGNLDRHEVLPELLVTSSSLDDLQNEDLRPDSASEWMRLIEKERPRPRPVPAAGEQLSDVDRYNLVASIGSRLFDAAQSCAGTAVPDRQAIRDLGQVIRDCERLENAPPSPYFRTEKHNLPRKKTDAVRYIAVIEAKQGRRAEAIRQFEEAIERYRQLELPEEMAFCVGEIAALELEEHRVDAALDRLLAVLPEMPEGSLARADLLATVAAVYHHAGDDREALGRLAVAKKIVDDSGIAVSSGSMYAKSLIDTLMKAGDDDAPSYSESSFHRHLSARALHRRIRTLYATIYRKQGKHELADRCLTELGELDGSIREGSQYNFDFSNEMLKNLDVLLKKLT